MARCTEKIKRDNRGSTMVLVIVCMFLVSIIGMMILSSTMMNFELKTIEKLSTENFYNTESFIEEFTTELRQETMNAYEDAYVSMLKNYVSQDDSNRKQEFFRKLAAELGLIYDAFSGTWSLNQEVSNGPVTIYNMVRDMNEKVKNVDENGSFHIDPANGVEVNYDDGKVTLKNVSLEYTEDDYSTEITTDIVLNLSFPDMSLAYNTAVETLYESDFVIIANEDVSTALTVGGGLGGSLLVDGNIYAGNDLVVNSSLLNINATEIFAGNSLRLNDGAKLSVAMAEKEEYDGIWTRNIDIYGGTAELDCNCFVADDLTFSKEGGRFIMNGGSYYGFSYTNDAETDPTLSSAIVINYPDIELNLYRAELLWLSGNSFIYDRTAFSSAGPGEDYNQDKGVLEGEAIAYKNIQAAYLLPGPCVIGVGHNPIFVNDRVVYEAGEVLTYAFLLQEDRMITGMGGSFCLPAGSYLSQDIVSGGTVISQGTTTEELYLDDGVVIPKGSVLASGTKIPFRLDVSLLSMITNKIDTGSGERYFTEDGYYVDITQNRLAGGIMLERYIDTENAFTIRVDNTSGIVYFYLLFSSARTAASYYQEYSLTNKGQASLAQLENLGSSTILLPADEENIVSIGNLLTYNSSASVPFYALIAGTTENATQLLPKKYALTQKFNALMTSLNVYDASFSAGTSIQSAYDIFDGIINVEQLKEDYNMESEGRRPVFETEAIEVLGMTFHMCAAYYETNYDTTSDPAADDIVLSEIRGDSSLENTVIITNRDVVVDIPFNGLILAGGDVTIVTGGVVETGAIKLNDLIQDEEVGRYFNVYTDEGERSGSVLEMNDIISVGFENWIKN